MKNIVLCLDGTGDWAGTDSTNVHKIFKVVKPEGQVAYYDGGVGTLNPPSSMTATGKFVRRTLDAAVATGLRDKVIGGYTFLIENYKPGDKIFIFGFSRGAYTARVLVGLLYNFGLLKPEHSNLTPYLWQTYSSFGAFKGFKQSANRIKKDFSIGVPVHVNFMGLFDTVSSVGIVKRFQTFPNTDFNPNVDRICHAVSIDEQRNCFPESLFNPKTPGLTEVWFPGVHRDVGGGYAKDDSGLPNVPLAWIVQQARLQGLDLEDVPVDPKAKRAPHFFPFDPYVFAGIYPMKVWSNLARGWRIFWPNFSHIRPIPQNALIHISVQEYLKSGFRPLNLPKNPCYFDPSKDGDDLQPKFYEPQAIGPNVADFVGITLGIGIGLSAALAIAQDALASFAGSGALSWPALTAWRVAGLLFVFMLAQGLGQRYNHAAKKPLQLRSEGILGIAGGLLAPLLMRNLFHDWRPIGLDCLAGLFICAIAQLPPGGPVIRADRVLPLFVLPWIGSALACRALSSLIDATSGTADTLDGPAHLLHLALAILVLFLFVVIAVIGIGSIVLDRQVGRETVVRVEGPKGSKKPSSEPAA